MLPIRLSELPEAPLDVSQSGIFPVSDVPNDITYKLSLQQIPSLSAKQNIQVKTSSYTVTKNDYNSVLYFNNEIATTVNLTIPNNNTKKIQPGYSIKIIRYNLGHVHIVPESGVTIYSPSGLYPHSQYSVATLTKIDINTWIITGHLSPIPRRTILGNSYPLVSLDDPNNVVVIGTQIDDDQTNNRSIGFTFPMLGTPYTSLGISSNGSIRLESSTYNYIGIMGADLHTYNGNVVENSTSYPGIYSITWNNISWYSERGPAINMQMLLIGPNNQLGLPSGSIIFNYGYIQNINRGAHIGIGNFVLYYSWQERNGQIIAALPGSNSEGYIDNVSVLTNQTFLFRPNSFNNYDIMVY
jgi:hypothetical protein